MREQTFHAHRHSYASELYPPSVNSADGYPVIHFVPTNVLLFERCQYYYYKDLTIFSYLIFQVLLRNLHTCPFREYHSMSEIRAAIRLAAGRTIARYLRDVIKTRARNSDVTRTKLRFSEYALTIHEVPSSRRILQAARLGSARLDRLHAYGNARRPAGRFTRFHSFAG